MAQVISLIDAGKLFLEQVSGGGDSFARLDRIRQAFLAKVAAGTATPTDVLNLVLTIDLCGYESMPSSEGMAWLRYNAETFAEIVGDVEVFLESVLALVDRAETDRNEKLGDAGQLRYDFFRGFLGSHELMGLLSPAWRERFVRELFPRFGAHTNSWVAVATHVGVPRSVMAEAILARLRHPTNGAGYAHGFLDYNQADSNTESPVPSTVLRLGREHDRRWYTEMMRDPAKGWAHIERIVRERHAAIEDGRQVPVLPYKLFMYFPTHETPTEEQKWRRCFDGLTEWAILLNNELETALILCAEYRPTETIAKRDAMARRLGAGMVDLIVDEAIGRLTSVSGISDTEMARLSVTDRKSLAERLTPVSKSYDYLVRPTAAFLFRLLTDLLTTDERCEFYEKTICRILPDANPTTLYATWRQLGIENGGLDGALRARLDAAGYWVGTIVRVPNPRGGTQWAVTYPGHRITYVEERGNHRYFPSEGDLVMFRFGGRHLTPYVVAVSFVPVMKDLRS